MDRDDFIKDWLEGKISAADLEKKLKDEENAFELKSIVEQSALLKVPQKKSKEEAWKILSEKLKEKKSKKLTPWIPLSIAASLALIIASYFIFFRSEIVQTNRGEHLAYTLPDGSQVWLNADSKISFKDFGTNDSRKIKLDGEAFFDVKEGGPFVVEGRNGSVQVLGTTFNVNLRDKKLEVACFTGVVKVRTRTEVTVTLNAKEFTRSTENAISSPQAIDAEKTGSWRTGDFYFENTPLSEVISELERQFDFDISYDEKAQRNYTGYFNTKDSDEALHLVFTPMALKFKKEGKKVVVE